MLAGAMLLAGLGAASPVLAQDGVVVPVIGREGPGSDGCIAIGRILAFATSASAIEPVRAAPSAQARRVDQLPARTLVWLCEDDSSGDFQGIVYPSGAHQQLGDCRVSSPIATPRPYDGPCRHGWVAARSIVLVSD